MEYTAIYCVLQRVAADHCVSVEEVMKEIAICIDAAVETAERENNIEALAIWHSIPRAGDKPTPVELLAFLANKIKENR